MAIITMEKLENADKDADSLDDFVNGNGKKKVKTRRGAEYLTAPGVEQTLLDNGLKRGFANKAALEKYKPSIEGSLAQDMETKKVWRWDGAKWNDEGASELDLAKDFSKKNNYIIQGFLTKMEFLVSSNSYLISHTSLILRRGGGRGYVMVEAAEDIIIPANSAYHIDLTNLSVNTANHTISAQIASGWTSSSYGVGAFVDDLKYPLFAWNDTETRVGGYLYQQGLYGITKPAIDYLGLRLNANNYVLQGYLTKFEYSGSNSTYTISHTSLILRRGGGRGYIFVAAAEDIIIPTNSAYYIDLTDIPINSVNQTVSAQIASAWTSSSHGVSAFVDDLKYPLFAWNDTETRVGGRLVQNGLIATLNPKFLDIRNKNRKNNYVVMGGLSEAVFDTKTVQYSITHSSFRIFLGSGLGMVTVLAQNGLIVPNNGCYYVDTEGARDGQTLEGKIATAWTSSSYGIGAFVDDFKIPLFTFRGTSGTSCGGELVQNGMPQTKVATLDTISVTKTENRLEFFIKGTGSNYLRYLMSYINNPALELTNKYGHIKMWRFTRVDEVNSSFFSILNSIVGNGESELAIAGGWSDAVGGFHGDEVQTKPAIFIVDGKYYAQDSEFSGDFKEIRFMQETDMFICNTETVFAKHIKDYIFNKDGLFIRQKLKFTQTIQLTNVYFGMLCWGRVVSSKQVSKTAIYPDLTLLDVTTNDFTRLPRSISKGESITLTGDIGLSAEVKVLDTNLYDYHVHISNREQDNKIYFTATEFFANDENDKVFVEYKEGQILESTLHYKLNTTN
ncbi:hypothetical protein B9T31_16930 [Acinetobacter sp. ANC 4558]|uniref:hypothetical protein n=1 Tax=Acinetobacter sp. ANC 4558 TaxID=1977876 RepID=UPI000A33B2BB|nr:hypothetical protein [Acinetobacter sp. ANC 4558]OTG79573.1 hypothetical protein B9T31_16930 [Acinetobacter sp. ANC 4558]